MSHKLTSDALDWADDMAIGLIAEALGKSYLPARREIARRLRALQATVIETVGVADRVRPQLSDLGCESIPGRHQWVEGGGECRCEVCGALGMPIFATREG